MFVEKTIIHDGSIWENSDIIKFRFHFQLFLTFRICSQVEQIWQRVMKRPCYSGQPDMNVRQIVRIRSGDFKKQSQTEFLKAFVSPTFDWFFCLEIWKKTFWSTSTSNYCKIVSNSSFIEIFLSDFSPKMNSIFVEKLEWSIIRLPWSNLMWLQKVAAIITWQKMSVLNQRSIVWLNSSSLNDIVIRIAGFH